MSSSRRRLQGVTLIELLVVIVILAIMAALALPSFGQLIVSQRIKTAASSLNAALMQTRSEALKRNKSVVLTPLLGTQWNTGWTVADPDDASKSLLQAAAVSNVSISGPVSVTFTSSGRVSGSNATFKLYSTETSDIRCVSISLSGIPTVRTSGC